MAGEFQPGGSMAAVYSREVGLRIYFQDQDSYIRESTFVNGKWEGGNVANILFRATHNTPLAALAIGNWIRIYYVNRSGTLQEHCNDRPGSAWFIGQFGASKKAPAAPNTRLAVNGWTFQGVNGVQLRVYYQSTNGVIIEHCWVGNTWIPGSTMPSALLGTSLATPCPLGSFATHPVLRVYFQDPSGWSKEHVYTDQWRDGNMLSVELPMGAPIAAIGWDNLSSTRVYYRSYSNEVIELNRGNTGWVANTRHITGSTAISMITAAVNASPANLRVFFQNNSTQLQEIEWIGNVWKMGPIVPTGSQTGHGENANGFKAQL